MSHNFFNLALYISLFPQLIAGPIVKYRDIQAQLCSRTVTVKSFQYGAKRFLYGLGKKVLISNVLAYPADQIFSLSDTTLNTPVAWFGIICYTLQIYYDFSGYSDMAIGLGKMFGFDFMENFKYPYLSTSIKEFWTRWHISLSSWFREYVYIPLGGNRNGIPQTYRNLLIVFFITGIWHGANWTFLLWGMFHGCFIILERTGFGSWLENNTSKIIQHIYTLLVVMIAWVFFKSESVYSSFIYIRKMFAFDFKNINTIYLYLDRETCLVLILAITLCGILQRKNKKLEKLLYDVARIQWLEWIFLLFTFALCFIRLVSSTYNPFIYFQF